MMVGVGPTSVCRGFAGAVAAALLLSAALAGSADAAPPARATLNPGESVRWQGERYAAAANVSNANPFGSQLCPGDAGAVAAVHVCDLFELRVEVPDGYWNRNRKGGVKVTINWGSAANDFDMYAFRKPPSASGWIGNVVTSSAEGGTTEETIRLYNPDGSYLIRVNPFTVAASGYTGKARFFEQHPIPRPRGGVKRVQASHGGFLSYSEPTIAMDPVRPNRLVAASKMYQDLGTYRFKIGTFFSRDGGRSWRENGMLPGYPRQTGAEDDYYRTSDPWAAYDDEGNAYVMVLDEDDTSDSLTRSGWGMTLHRSEDGGKTWSRPIPIHRNDDPISNNVFLDDKNTIAVDNSGPDRDGKTGNLYSCWSFDTILELAGLQVGANLAVQVARSTTAGRRWETPRFVSGVDRQVIGCHVVIGPPERPGGPGTVYVFWLNFGADQIRMAKSTDGGTTYSLPRTVAEISSLPGSLPPTEFTTLSIPWAAVDPVKGTVYVSWADYHQTMEGEICPPEEDAPEGQVCDGDILLVRSGDGGETWSRPVRVNQDPLANGRDQLQQALAVTEDGQLNMMWFDRRRDAENFYIDTFFARSNDGGATWHETRITREMWDPEMNPPNRPGGHFIGDYEGIVATDRVAIPFWQDTTAANRPGGSPYQQVFSARIPNTREFGGRRR